MHKVAACQLRNITLWLRSICGKANIWKCIFWRWPRSTFTPKL